MHLVEFPDEGHSGPAFGCHRAILAQFLTDPTREPETSCVASIPPIQFATTWAPTRSLWVTRPIGLRCFHVGNAVPTCHITAP